MTDVSREELNARAAELGVDAPGDLPNKQAVAEAIASVEAQPAPRTFALRAPADGDENPVYRVSCGDSPRVSLGTGETFSTADEKLAERLAADPILEELQQ